jgi:uncharacterized protein (TIGR00725 family)
MTDKKICVAVIGGGQPTTTEVKEAEEVGRALARRGVVLICGGLGGVMEAACRGADSENGVTVGILPGDSRRAANRYVQIPIVTGIGYARNVAVVKSAHAVIAIGGSYGTLTEIGHALQSGIPVVGLNTWGISRNGREDGSIFPAKTPADAVEMALELAGAGE